MKSPKILDIFIVDDHELVRQGLRLLINNETDLQVCGEAASVYQAIQMKQNLSPDIAVIDISLADGSGLELVKNLHLWRPEMRIIVLSMHQDELFAERSLQSGAMGYINKQDSASKILEAIRCVAQGKIYLSPKMTERLLGQFSKQNQPKQISTFDLLTNRELEVFQLIGKGTGTSQIAEQLKLSVKTVDTHRANIKKKLKLTSAAELARAAVLWSIENSSEL